MTSLLRSFDQALGDNKIQKAWQLSEESEKK